MYKFNASFRLSVAAVADELGLVFISTKRQVENGTLMFNDPQCDVKYAMYESGYVRRLTPLTYCYWGNSHTISDRKHAMYQLNRTRKATYISKYNGREYTQKERIKANPEEQLGIMVKSVVLWRNRCN